MNCFGLGFAEFALGGSGLIYAWSGRAGPACHGGIGSAGRLGIGQAFSSICGSRTC